MQKFINDVQYKERWENEKLQYTQTYKKLRKDLVDDLKENGYDFQGDEGNWNIRKLQDKISARGEISEKSKESLKDFGEAANALQLAVYLVYLNLNISLPPSD